MFEEFIGVNFWDALFVLLNTLAIFFVGKKYLFGPVKKMIDSRQQEIDAMYRDAGQARDQAQQMRTEYQQKLDEAQHTGERIVRDAVTRGQNREEEIIRQANQNADAILEKASSDIAREKKKAMNEAKNEIADIALTIAGKVVGRELNSKDQAKLVDQFIDELG